MSWQVVPLGYSVSEVRRKNLGGREQNLLSLSYGHIVRKDIASSEGLLPESFDTYNVVEPGDTVLRLTDLQNDQRSLRVGLVRERGIITSAYVSIRPGREVDSRYLNYFLKHLDFRKEFYALGAGVRQSLKFDELKGIHIPRPSVTVQRAIADYLDAETARIDALIAKKQRMIELLEERRVAAVDHAVTSGDGPMRPVSALANYINGWPFKPEDFTTAGTPVIRIAQLTNPDLEPDFFDGALPDRVTLRDGDLVFSWSGSLQVRRWVRGHAYLNQHLFRVLPVAGVDVAWLAHALDTATRLFGGHMHGSAMTHITKPMMKLVQVPLPQLNSQEVVASELDVVCRLIERTVERLQVQIDLLREHRQALITAAVTGELEVPGVAA